jgi:hypothetical protein
MADRAVRSHGAFDAGVFVLKRLDNAGPAFNTVKVILLLAHPADATVLAVEDLFAGIRVEELAHRTIVPAKNGITGWICAARRWRLNGLASHAQNLFRLKSGELMLELFIMAQAANVETAATGSPLLAATIVMLAAQHLLLRVLVGRSELLRRQRCRRGCRRCACRRLLLGVCPCHELLHLSPAGSRA